jgi:hypothetical protein
MEAVGDLGLLISESFVVLAYFDSRVTLQVRKERAASQSARDRFQLCFDSRPL